MVSNWVITSMNLSPFISNFGVCLNFISPTMGLSFGIIIFYLNVALHLRLPIPTSFWSTALTLAVWFNLLFRSCFMTNSSSRVPLAKRRRLWSTMGLFEALVPNILNWTCFHTSSIPRAGNIFCVCLAVCARSIVKIPLLDATANTSDCVSAIIYKCFAPQTVAPPPSGHS